MRLELKNEKTERVLKIVSIVLMAACAALFLYTLVRYKPKPVCMEILPYPIALVVLCWILRGDYAKRPVYWLAAAFAVWFGVSRLLIRDIYGRQAFYYYAEIAIVYLFAFPFARAIGERTALRVFDWVALAFVAAVTAASVLGLWVVISGQPVAFADGKYCTELVENRLWVLAVNPNISAVFMVLALLLTIYLLLRHRKRWAYAVAVPVVLIDYLALAATDSRTAKISFLVCIAVVAAMLVAKGRKGRGAIRVATVVGAAVAAALICYFAFSLGVRTLNGCAAAYGRHDGAAATAQVEQPEQSEPDAQAQTQTEAMVTERAVVDEPSSGRGFIYYCAYRYLCDHPSVLWKGANNLSIRLMSCYGLGDNGYYLKAHLHNAFLQTLASTGVEGLVLVFAICVFLLVASLRVLLSPKRSAAEKMLPVLLLVFIIDSMAECPLFVPYDVASNSFMNFFFFLCAGYVVELGQKSKTERRLAKEEALER